MPSAKCLSEKPRSWKEPISSRPRHVRRSGLLALLALPAAFPFATDQIREAASFSHVHQEIEVTRSTRVPATSRSEDPDVAAASKLSESAHELALFGPKSRRPAGLRATPDHRWKCRQADRQSGRDDRRLATGRVSDPCRARLEPFRVGTVRGKWTTMTGMDERGAMRLG